MNWILLRIGLFLSVVVLSMSVGSADNGINSDQVKSEGKQQTANAATSCNAKEGTFDQPIIDHVKVKDSRSYVYTYKYFQNQTWTISVCIECKNATQKVPLLVVVRQSQSIMSWQVPLDFVDSDYEYHKVCHTLCPLRNYFDPSISYDSQDLYIDVSSNSPVDTNFTLMASKVTDFVIETNEVKALNITPSDPKVQEYIMPEGVESVLIQATSSNDMCMILAIQDIKCPFYDTERNVEHKGFFQTMTSKSGITLSRKSFNDGRVYIVMILKATDTDCTDNNTAGEEVYRSKEVILSVHPTVTDKEFYEAIFGAFGFYLGLYAFSFAVCFVLFVKKRKTTSTTSTSTTTLSRELENVNQTNSRVPNYGSTSVSSEEESSGSTVENSVYSIPVPRVGRRRASAISLDETDMDKLPDIEVDKNVIRTKTVLYVADLARKKEKYLSGRTKVYSWNLLTIAIFYGLPAVQLVYTNQRIVNLTGNQDVCYYNFLCSHKTWMFSDFNHIYSNIGYVMLGLLFLLLVSRRDVLHSQNMDVISEEGVQTVQGIPHHFGLFYSMGWALIMEGILSASYHVCPNKANFQFDTAFMYVIATVCMLKLYQGRHPDITAKSHVTWLLMAVIIFIGVIGVLRGGILFWILFAAGHILTTFLLSTNIYYMGRWKLNRGIFKRILLHMKHDVIAGSFRPTYKGRFCMLGVTVLLNITIDLYGLITRPAFATFLLAVFIMNLLLYLIYYTTMKVWYKERIRWIPLMYIFLSFLSWGAAMYFFLQKNTSWELTPALSRDHNKPCIILNFYDDHDIWHFISSCALFFSFMVLFTLDDDLETTPRNEIIVF